MPNNDASSTIKHERFTGSIPDTLVQTCAEGKLVLFMGAGFSWPLFPTWRQLMVRLEDFALREGIGISDVPAMLAENRFAEIAEELERRLGSQRFYSFLREIFAPNKVITLPARHRLLPRLRLRGVLTTNFDELIEMAFHDVGQMPATKHHSSRGLVHLLSRTDVFVVHVHGSINEPPVVLNPNKFAELLKLDARFSECRSFLEHTFMTCPMLFLGYSFNDPDLNEIRGVIELLTPYRSASYALIPNATAEQISEQQAKGMTVISYHHPESGDEQHKQVDAFLHSLVTKVELKSATIAEDFYLLEIGDIGEGWISMGERLPERSQAIGRMCERGLLTGFGGSNRLLTLTDFGWEQYWVLANKFNYQNNRTYSIAHSLSKQAISVLKQLAKHDGKPVLSSELDPSVAIEELKRRGSELVAVNSNWSGGSQFIRLNRFGRYVAGIIPTIDS